MFPSKHQREINVAIMSAFRPGCIALSWLDPTCHDMTLWYPKRHSWPVIHLYTRFNQTVAKSRNRYVHDEDAAACDHLRKSQILLLIKIIYETKTRMPCSCRISITTKIEPRNHRRRQKLADMKDSICAANKSPETSFAGTGTALRKPPPANVWANHCNSNQTLILHN